MNDDLNRWGPGADREEPVVEEFFAAHRRAVVEHDADEQTWEAIRVRAGRTGRGGRGGLWFLGGVVAATAAATTAFLLAGQGLGGDVAEAPPASTPTDQVVATSTAAPSTTDDTTAGTTDGASDTTGTGAAEEPVAEPSTGTVLPMLDPDATIAVAGHPSGDESPLRVSVGQYDCEAGEREWACPALLVSEDSGQTWTRTVDMFTSGFYGAVSARGHIWMWGPDLTDTDRDDIPVTPSRLVRSDDGGQTWVEVATRGTTLGVETFRSTLVVVTEGCAGGGPEECAEVVVTDLTADDATSGRRTATLEGADPLLCTTFPAPGDLPRAEIYATYDAVYVEAVGGVYRLADGASVASVVERPRDCADVLPAPESKDGLVAWEPGTAAVWTSADGGASWQEVTDLPGGVSAAASNDGTRMVIDTDQGVFVGTGGAWVRVTSVDEAEVSEIWPLGGESVRVSGRYRYVAPDLVQHDGRDLAASWLTEDGGQTWTEEPQLAIPGAP
ncbi:hypothetical protein [Ornithinimicrobium tianjinense]|uniref:BNR/Asp-box repeat-containing protein n=1 Tax=Ornithinimicrobium tianjinense TaxID=1195761 RepID=A0A917F4K4_9MICO|nr:hypothetical protein [Ornithinimicrobium tianjinense]GGF45818.1 hypothetical protein GCM10011366_11970 [Ornithinimicrobium tianjinense]